MGGTVPTERPTEPTPTDEPNLPPQDGSWDGTKQVNTPKVAETGLIPVYHNGSTWVDLTSSSTAEEWNKWYDYENKQWANARTADGSMWVWIPRYEYQISGKTINVNFIEGTGTETTTGYTLHPAFSTDIANGGWSSDISGFWVAKYPAGWQNGTNGVNTSIGTPKYSSLTYQTSSSSNTYVGIISNNSTKISYPVFKANTYAYNYISVGDAYRISQEIKNATEMYGLNSTVDSHLQKNSEWGAVAYLAHSKYGVNGEDKVVQNTTNKSNSPTGIYAVTSPESTVNTSTTQNITGVYDLSGCVHERVASFFPVGDPTYTKGMPTGTANKYVTLYTTNDKKGDATNETSGWNGDYADFAPTGCPVFYRGGNYGDTSANAGLFYYGSTAGAESYSSGGFRTVLIPN